MKGFGFVSDAAEDEFRALPDDIKHDFGVSMRALQNDKKPFVKAKQLNSIGAGVTELIINGSPVWRCVYIAKYMDAVIVLHSFSKTTNGVDRPAMALAKKRYQTLMDEVRKMKKEQKQTVKNQTSKASLSSSDKKTKKRR